MNERVAKARETWSGLNRYPYFRALVKQAGYALWATGTVWLLAWGSGTRPSLLAIILLHIVIAAWMTAEADAPPDPTAEEAALAAFSETPLGALTGAAREELAGARRTIGREAVMHRTLDRLVRATRRIETRLAVENAADAPARPALGRVVRRELPLIASTAKQYALMQGQEAIDPERLATVEGVLREAVDRFEALASGTGVEGPVGMARLDADAEVLADYMATDLGAARGRAQVLRIAHRLDRAASTLVPELEYKVKAVVDLLKGRADDPAIHALVEERGARFADLAEVADMDTAGRAALRMALEDWRGALEDGA